MDEDEDGGWVRMGEDGDERRGGNVVDLFFSSPIAFSHLFFLLSCSR